MNGHFDAAKIFLERGIDPNITSLTGSTALHLAMVNSHLKIGALLLSHPALDKTIKDGQGKTAQDVALTKANQQLSDLFTEKGGDLVQLLSLEQQVAQLMERTTELEERHKHKQNEIGEIYKQFKILEDQEIILVEKESRLQFQLQHKCYNSKQGIIDEFNREYEKEVKKTLQLEEELRAHQTPSTEHDLQHVANAYQNIQRVKKLMNTISNAFRDSTTPLNKLCTLMGSFPEQMEEDPEETPMEMEPVVTSKNPPFAGFLIE